MPRYQIEYSSQTPWVRFLTGLIGTVVTIGVFCLFLPVILVIVAVGIVGAMALGGYIWWKSRQFEDSTLKGFETSYGFEQEREFSTKSQTPQKNQIEMIDVEDIEETPSPKR